MRPALAPECTNLTSTVPIAGMSNTAGGHGVFARGRRNVVGFGTVVYRAWRAYGLSGSPLMAAAIAFYSVVCLGPLGILLSGVLKLIFGEGTNTYDWIHATVKEFGEPIAGQIMTQVDGLLASPDQFYASAVSIAMVIWAGLHLFETVERSLTQIWPGTILRGFLGRKLISLGMMSVAGLLLGAFVVANAFFARLHGLLAQFPEIDADAVIQAQPRVMILLGFLLSLFAFTGAGGRDLRGGAVAGGVADLHLLDEPCGAQQRHLRGIGRSGAVCAVGLPGRTGALVRRALRGRVAGGLSVRAAAD